MWFRREAVKLGPAGFALGLVVSTSAMQGDSPGASRFVRLTFELRSESAAVGPGRIVARPLTTVAEAPQPVVRPLPETLSAGLRLDLDPTLSWRVLVEAPGLWSVPTVVGPQDREARIELLPTAPIEILAEAPRGRDPPPTFTVEVRPAPGEPAFPAAKIECPAAKDLWRCEVPAGRIDVKIAAADYVPVYLWGQRLEAGKLRSIDAGELRTGASVSGFVAADDGDAKGVRVRVEPVLLLPEAEGREQALAAEAAANDRGFFLLAGVEPGEYVVSARKEGYANARSEPVRVEEEAETRLLSSLRLERPVELEVFLTPPVDPFGERWQVEAEREDPTSRRSHPATRHPASAAGAWVQPGLDPGQYVLRVFDSRGSIVTQRQMNVTRVSPPVELEVEVVPVEGLAQLGEDPLEAHLTLSGIRGGARMRRVRRGLVLEGTTSKDESRGGEPEVPDTRRVAFSTDSEGRFAGYLPNEGFWEVEVHTAAGTQIRLPDPIEVRRPEDGGPAEIEIVVPDTRLEVRVRDRSGRPAAGAAVSLIDPETGVPTARAETDADGVAPFWGLPELPVLVEARGREGGRAAVRVEPSSDEETRVELVLEPTLRVEGVVTSLAGPVPGVLLEFRPVGVGAPGWTTTTTGADGRFRFSVPAGSSAVEVIVLAPGLPLRLARLPIEPSGGRARMHIHLEDVGGTLRLGFENGVDPTAVQVAHGGAIVDLLSLLGVLVSTPEPFNQDGDIVLPLEPGGYTVCSPAPNCQQVFVSPGASSEIVLGGAKTDSGEL